MTANVADHVRFTLPGGDLPLIGLMGSDDGSDNREASTKLTDQCARKYLEWSISLKPKKDNSISTFIITYIGPGCCEDLGGVSNDKLTRSDHTVYILDTFVVKEQQMMCVWRVCSHSDKLVLLASLSSLFRFDIFCFSMFFFFSPPSEWLWATEIIVTELQQMQVKTRRDTPCALSLVRSCLRHSIWWMTAKRCVFLHTRCIQMLNLPWDSWVCQVLCFTFCFQWTTFRNIKGKHKYRGRASESEGSRRVDGGEI